MVHFSGFLFLDFLCSIVYAVFFYSICFMIFSIKLEDNLEIF